MSLLNNLKSFVASKSEAKKQELTPSEKARNYAQGLEASDGVKLEAGRLMHQAEVTKKAVNQNLEKAEARKTAESNDQNALVKLTTDLEAIAVEVIANQEKTQRLNEEAASLKDANTEVRDALSNVSFSTLIAATKAAKTNTVKSV